MAAATKTLVLVTGATSGIGLELVAQLMAKGSYHVLAGARSAEKGQNTVKDLQSRSLPGSVEMILIDATNDSTIECAAADVERNHGKLDILVNNAATAAMDLPLRQQLQESFNTNATGPAIIAKAFGPLLKKSSASPRIVNVSSGLGSIGRALDRSSPTYGVQEVQYRASKAALNMISACQYVEYEPAGIKVFAYCPGFTVSNLGPYNKVEHGARATSESVVSLVELLEGKRDGDVRKLLQNTGEHPW